MSETSTEEFDYTIKDDDIERARLLIGLEAPQGGREYYSHVDRDGIRNFARGYGDDNPLYNDPDYGRHTRWGSQITPPMMHIALSNPTYGDPIPEDVRRKTKGLFSGIHLFVSGQSSEWYRPLYPGDELYGFGGLESVEEKKSEFAERSVIRVHRGVRMNQRGEIVSIHRGLLIATERKKSRERGKYMHIKPATYTDEDIAKIDEIYAQERRRGATPRCFEDVEIGEELPKMAKGPLTLTEVIVFHAGGYGFAPYNISASRIAYKNRQKIPKFYVKNEAGIPDVAQRLHWENEWSQKIGNPMAYDYAVMRQCWLSHYLTDWVGDDGWVFRQHDEMRKFNYIGDTHVITGEVTDKHVENGRCYVDIVMRATNQRGDVTAPAEATVMLPSREHGPVLLPEPSDELKSKAIRIMTRHRQLEKEMRDRGDGRARK
jgi:acyl dehydratase